MSQAQASQPRSRSNRQPASRGQSGSSVDEDTKILGNSAGGASSSRLQKPALSVDVSASNDPSGGQHKSEKIERIGMIRGSSHVRSKDKDAVGAQESATSIGLQDDAVYDAYLSPPIAYLRRLLVSQLRREAPWHARHQKAVRRPWLDRYFVNTSLLGTHSFFLVFLPMTFWLGSPRFARGIINVLALGVYLSSAIKDLFCVPRPLSPPVTRLTIGTHHLEYGFVSTHSTNSVSIALFVYLWVRQIRQAQTIEDLANGIVGSSVISETTATIFSSRWWEVSLLFYAVSVVYGRIYAGMHSIADCIAGSLLGAGITGLQWYFFDHIEDFIKLQSWYVPLAIVPAGLVMVSVHPQPIEDCPCFEDAIAFVSVSIGIALARWSCVNFDMMLSRDPYNHALAHLGQDFKLLAHGPQAKFRLPLLKLTAQPGLVERLVKAALVLVLGVATVLMVRVVAKLLCKILLPPIFRFVDQLIGFSLPRRHYTQAKDYDNIPLDHLGSLPSAIDLPSQIFVTDESGKRHLVSSPGPSRQSSADVRNGSAASSLTALSNPSHLPRSPLVASPSHSPLPSRSNSPNPIEARSRLGSTRSQSLARKAQFTVGGSMDEDDPADDLPIPLTQSKAHPNFVAPDEKLARHLAAELKGTTPKKVEKEVKHYDADVLTKVIVYANIGLFSGGFIPAFFERLGLI